MIIDCHGHYTTAPAKHTEWREQQKGAFKAGGDIDPAYPQISDDEIRETIEANQLRLLRERGAAEAEQEEKGEETDHGAPGLAARRNPGLGEPGIRLRVGVGPPGRAQAPPHFLVLVL